MLTVTIRVTPCQVEFSLSNQWSLGFGPPAEDLKSGSAATSPLCGRPHVTLRKMHWERPAELLPAVVLMAVARPVPNRSHRHDRGIDRAEWPALARFRRR